MALRPNGLIDRVLGLLAYSAIATSRFLLGLLLILGFAVYWQMFPSTGFQPLSAGLLGNWLIRRATRRDHRRAGIRGVFPGAA